MVRIIKKMSLERAKEKKSFFGVVAHRVETREGAGGFGPINGLLLPYLEMEVVQQKCISDKISIDIN